MLTYMGFTIVSPKEELFNKDNNKELYWVAERHDHRITVQQWVLDNRFSMVKYMKKKIKDYVLSSY
jgi:hypothetical protein